MPERSLASAKEIVAKGIEYSAWDWDDPDSVDDASVMNAAKQLVDGATQASKNGSVNDAVLEILFAAQIEPTSEPTREAYTRRFKVELPSDNGHGEPQQVPTPQPMQVFHPADSDQSIDINSIYPGYDDQKVADIKKAVLHFASTGELSPEEWEKIKAYETSHEERKTILSLQPEFKAPEPEPAPESHSVGPSATGAFAQPNVISDGVTATATDSDTSLETVYNGESVSRAAQEGLPIPPQLHTEGALTIPIDITNVSDQELSRLATQFHSLFARAQWLLSQEEGRERSAEALEQDAHRDAFARAVAQHESAIPADKRTASAVENARRQAGHDADVAEPVRVWRSRKVRHGIEARELKALAVGFDKAVWRINEELERRSRLATTRPPS